MQHIVAHLQLAAAEIAQSVGRLLAGTIDLRGIDESRHRVGLLARVPCAGTGGRVVNGPAERHLARRIDRAEYRIPGNRDRHRFDPAGTRQVNVVIEELTPLHQHVGDAFGVHNRTGLRNHSVTDLPGVRSIPACGCRNTIGVIRGAGKSPGRIVAKQLAVGGSPVGVGGVVTAAIKAAVFHRRRVTNGCKHDRPQHHQRHPRQPAGNSFTGTHNLRLQQLLSCPGENHANRDTPLLFKGLMGRHGRSEQRV